MEKIDLRESTEESNGKLSNSEENNLKRKLENKKVVVNKQSKKN